MKKFLFLSAIAVALVSTSCNREKDCECISTIDGQEVGRVTQTTKESCSDFNVTQETFGIVSSTTCREK
ncbi:MAG: hypothetical protein ACXITV_02440 [Luteibaculaceae bacterium]